MIAIVSQPLTPVILDGAHVPFNLAAMLHDLNRIRELAGFCVVVFGTTRDKQAFEMLDLLRRHRVDVVICTRSTPAPHHELLMSFAASLKNLISPLKSFRSRAMQ
jgi:dihydrofolate synthase/folylpolyglutamate synthase